MVLFEILESMPQKGKPRHGGMPDRGYLMRIIERLEVMLADKQKEAIKSALENNIAVITGGPGTGKTTIY